MILLDTNVISEVMKLRPEAAVMAWIDAQDGYDLCTCTIVAAEIFSGLDLMPAGRRQVQLREKTEFMFSDLFAGRILGFDLPAARAYGAILKSRKAIGRPIDQTDAFIGAIALANGTKLATRNTSNFGEIGIDVVNPWL